MFVRVKVLSSQPQSQLREILSDGTLKVAVKAPRQKGRANRELICFFAKYFGVEKKNVRIVNGHTSELKLIEIEKEIYEPRTLG